MNGPLGNAPSTRFFSRARNASPCDVAQPDASRTEPKTCRAASPAASDARHVACLGDLLRTAPSAAALNLNASHNASAIECVRIFRELGGIFGKT